MTACSFQSPEQAQGLHLPVLSGRHGNGGDGLFTGKPNSGQVGESSPCVRTCHGSPRGGKAGTWGFVWRVAWVPLGRLGTSRLGSCVLGA